MTDLECIKYWLKKDAEFVKRAQAQGDGSQFTKGHARGREFQIQSILDVIKDIEENK